MYGIWNILKSTHKLAPSPFMKLLIRKQHLHRIRAYVFGLSRYKNSHPIVPPVSYSTNRNINTFVTMLLYHVTQHTTSKRFIYFPHTHIRSKLPCLAVMFQIWSAPCRQ